MGDLMTMTAPRVLRLLPAAAAFALAVAAWPAHAAPQILALVETPAPLPMTCTDGTCRAELSAMCLQKERVTPEPGMPYRAAAPDHVRVVLTTGTGERIALDGDALRFRATRGYTSVDVVVPADVLAAHGRVTAEVAVARVAAVVPVPVAGDANPITEAEVEKTVGLRRMAAIRAERVEAPLVTAARAANRLVNGAGEDWPAIARDLGVAADGPGIRRAQEMAAVCRRYAAEKGEAGFDGCLQFRHDWLMRRVNDTYYRRTDVGS